MNLRPSGYEPDELPGCSTPRYPVFAVRQNTVRFLPKTKYRLSLDPGPVFAERKIRFVTLASHFARIRKHKGRFERPFGFGRAECVSRRSLSVFYLAVKT